MRKYKEGGNEPNKETPNFTHSTIATHTIAHTYMEICYNNYVGVCSFEDVVKNSQKPLRTSFSRFLGYLDTQAKSYMCTYLLKWLIIFM